MEESVFDRSSGHVGTSFGDDFPRLIANVCFEVDDLFPLPNDARRSQQLVSLPSWSQEIHLQVDRGEQVLSIEGKRGHADDFIQDQRCHASVQGLRRIDHVFAHGICDLNLSGGYRFESSCQPVSDGRGTLSRGLIELGLEKGDNGIHGKKVTAYKAHLPTY